MKRIDFRSIFNKKVTKLVLICVAIAFSLFLAIYLLKGVTTKENKAQQNKGHPEGQAQITKPVVPVENVAGIKKTVPAENVAGIEKTVPVERPSLNTPTTTKTTMTIDGMTVKYGAHTYGVKSQVEYDAVMGKVEAAVANIGTIKLDKYLTKYLSGDRAENYQKGDDNYLGLFLVYRDRGYFINKVSASNSSDVFKADAIYYKLASKKYTDPMDVSPSSPYDILFKGLGDSESTAQLQSAILDVMGYNTMILSNTIHADNIVEVDGVWWLGGKALKLSSSPKRLSDPTLGHY